MQIRAPCLSRWYSEALAGQIAQLMASPPMVQNGTNVKGAVAYAGANGRIPVLCFAPAFEFMDVLHTMHGEL